MPALATTAPYRRVLALALRERELVEEGLFDELHALVEERDRLVASLPEAAPVEARPVLARAAAVQAQTSHALEAARAALRAELTRLGTGRTTVRGYAPVAVAAHRVELAG